MEEPREEPKAGSPAWMATFSDLMTQLLVFFVFLFSMSSIEQEKFERAMVSFRGAFGVMSSTAFQVVSRSGKPQEGFYEPEKSIEERQVESMAEDLMKYVKEEGLREGVEVDENASGMVVRLTSKLVFPSGQADSLLKESVSVLDKVAEMIKELPNDIRIEGHTDNIPIRSAKYPSNWELSSARAMTVAKFFIDKKKISPVKLSVAGYGEYKPIAPNDTEINRQQNRRVEIVFLKTK